MNGEDHFLGQFWGSTEVTYGNGLGKWQNPSTDSTYYNSASFFFFPEKLEHFPKTGIVRLYVGPTAPPGGQL